MRNGFIADSREEAEALFAKHYIDEMRFYFDDGIFTHDPRIRTREDVTVENLRSALVIGNADDCIESLEHFRDKFEADYVVMRFRMNDGPSPERSLECIRQFGEQVLPTFHADLSTS